MLLICYLTVVIIRNITATFVAKSDIIRSFVTNIVLQDSLVIEFKGLLILQNTQILIRYHSVTLELYSVDTYNSFLIILLSFFFLVFVHVIYTMPFPTMNFRAFLFAYLHSFSLSFTPFVSHLIVFIFSFLSISPHFYLFSDPLTSFVLIPSVLYSHASLSIYLYY